MVKDESSALREQLANLNEISKLLMHCQSIQDGVEKALEQVRKHLNVQVASVFLFHKDGKVKRKGINGIDKNNQPIDNSWFAGEEYEPGESFSAKAVPPYDAESGYGEPQYSNQLEQDFLMIYRKRYLEKLGSLECGISVPLNGLYRTFGTLEVLNRLDGNGFSEANIYWLMMIGTSLANFISSFKHQESFEIQKSLIEKLVSVDIVVDPNFNLKNVYQFVAEKLISEATPYQVCIIRIPNEQEEEDLDIKEKFCTDDISWEGRKDGSVRAGSQIVGEVYRKKEPIYIEEIHEEELNKFNNKEWVKNNNLKSFACLPLLLKNQCFGTISVYTKYQHKFYKHQREFLEQIAFLTASITARVKIINELRKVRRERNEMTKRFLSASLEVSFGHDNQRIIHQYKNELINIYQFLDNLSENIHLSNKDIKSIEDQKQVMSRRIEELQDQLKKDDVSIVNINQTIQQVIEQFPFDMKIKIDLKKDLRIPEIEIEEKPMKDILFNLLANAEKAIERANRQKGEITLETHLDKSEAIEYIMITVEDNGTGIKNEIRDRVFDKGFTTFQNEGGTGFGLFLIREIINSYGGKIYFESKVGKGTKFYIKIPWQRYRVD